MQIEWELIGKTIIILILALISPGPDFVMALRNSLNYGRIAGLFTALGITSGCIISLSLSMVGIKILFQYQIISIIFAIVCGGYLIYMGVKSIFNKSTHQHINQHKHKTKNLLLYYQNGVMTNVFNPKLYSLAFAIFAFFEQQNPNTITSIVIILLQAVLTLIWFSGVSLIFSQGKIQDLYFKRERLISIILGLVLIGIGIEIIIR